MSEGVPAVGMRAVPDRETTRVRRAPVLFCAAVLVVQGTWMGVLAYLAVRFL